MHQITNIGHVWVLLHNPKENVFRDISNNTSPQKGGLLGGIYVPCIYRTPGGIIVGDSGLCCCGPVRCVTSIVRAQLLHFDC